MVLLLEMLELISGRDPLRWAQITNAARRVNSLRLFAGAFVRVLERTKKRAEDKLELCFIRRKGAQDEGGRTKEKNRAATAKENES